MKCKQHQPYDCQSTGFYDDNIIHNFGVIRKGQYRPQSDFHFTYLMKVNTDKAVNKGYMIKVTPEKSRGDHQIDVNEDDDEEENDDASWFVIMSC